MNTPNNLEWQGKNTQVNRDGTISPIDPSKPSEYSTLAFESTDTSEKGIIRAILLNMEWCHAVRTESLEKAVDTIATKLAEAYKQGYRDGTVNRIVINPVKE